MKNILFIVGSLREGSFNHQMAKKIEKLLEGRANVSYLDYKNVPLFNQDLENPVITEIVRIREEVKKADLIWIVSPVYNFSIPGVVKNLLDWLSRALDLSETRGPSILQDKLITVSSVANAGHEELFANFDALLPFIRTKKVAKFTASKINPEAWSSGQLTLSEEVLENLKNQVEEVLSI